MLKITNFKIEHLSLLDDQDGVMTYTQNPKMLEAFLEGPCYTIYVDEDPPKIVLMGGLVIQHDGVAVGWSWPTSLTEKYPLFSYKTSKWVVDEGFNTLGLHKIISYCFANDERARRYNEALGFTMEALLKQHGSNKEDMILYARFAEVD